jgi:hypothetical protein
VPHRGSRGRSSQPARDVPGSPAAPRGILARRQFLSCGCRSACKTAGSTSSASWRSARCSIRSARSYEPRDGWGLYRQYFVWKWRRSLRKKQEAWPDAYQSLGDILRLDNLTEMTDRAGVPVRRLRSTAGIPARLCARRRTCSNRTDDTRRPAGAHHRGERRSNHPGERSHATTQAASARDHADSVRRSLRVLCRRHRVLPGSNVKSARASTAEPSLDRSRHNCILCVNAGLPLPRTRVRRARLATRRTGPRPDRPCRAP